jgi:hypothetical protein
LASWQVKNAWEYASTDANYERQREKKSSDGKLKVNK